MSITTTPTSPSSLIGSMSDPLGDIANPLPVLNQVSAGSPITAASVPIPTIPSASSPLSSLPSASAAGQSTTSPSSPAINSNAAPAKPTVYQSGVSISDAQNSTMYGLAPDPTYDSNSGDVTSVSQTLINNIRAVQVADQFYMSVFGVGAAYPQDVYNFTDGSVNSISRKAGIWSYAGTGAHFSTTNSSSPQTTKTPQSAPKNGGEANSNLTAVGSLALVARQIESKESISAKFGIKFIDMTPNNYNGTQQQYVNQILTNKDLLEPGASPFLDYQELPDFVNNVVPNSNSGIIVKPIQ